MGKFPVKIGINFTDAIERIEKGLSSVLIKKFIFDNLSFDEILEIAYKIECKNLSENEILDLIPKEKIIDYLDRS